MKAICIQKYPRNFTKLIHSIHISMDRPHTWFCRGVCQEQHVARHHLVEHHTKTIHIRLLVVPEGMDVKSRGGKIFSQGSRKIEGTVRYGWALEDHVP